MIYVFTYDTSRLGVILEGRVLLLGMDQLVYYNREGARNISPFEYLSVCVGDGTTVKGSEDKSFQGTFNDLLCLTWAPSRSRFD